jgi:hypothetical protein
VPETVEGADVLGYVERFVPVSQPVLDLGRYGADTLSGADVVAAASFLVRINEQGARDLRCPRDQVLPFLEHAGYRAPKIPVAEGCGKRATYLPDETLRLSAIVTTGE